jgi:hypothetical protein
MEPLIHRTIGGRLRCLLAGLALLWAGFAHAQQPGGVHAGMVRVQATYALGLLNAAREQRYYLYGDAEAMVNDHLGVDGGIYVQLGSSQREIGVGIDGKGGWDMRAHTLLFGPNYHFRPQRVVDVYAGVQPGLHLVVQPAQDGILPVARHIAVAPAASAVAGIAWYGSFFHLFGQARGIWGQGVTGAAQYGITELRLSFGLGFNFN